MASNNDFDGGGYKLEFTTAPPESLKCPICVSVARLPWQHGKCGRVTCESCLEWYKKRRSQRSKHKCPHCKEDDPQFFKDNQSDQRIQELKVNCTNRQYGCSWTGELRFLGGHLTTCPYKLVTCPKKCVANHGKTYECFQKELDLHLREACPLRDYMCPRCQKWGTYTERMSSHQKVCPMMPTRCHNEGCTEEIPSHMLLSHASICEFALEDCKYRDLGCTDKVLRRDLQKHESDDRFHLHLLMRSVTELQGKLRQASQELSLLHRTMSSPTVTFKVTGFSKYRENEMFLSKPFYTSLRGYKLCARVIPKWQNQKVCMCIHLMRGEFDEELKWPYTGTMEVELLNQQENAHHISRTIQYLGNEGRRVEKGEMNETGYGFYNYITLDKLHHYQLKQRHRGPVFLVEDALYFRVTTKGTWLECTQPTH